MDYRHVTHEFPAFYHKDSKILILGSVPSVKSLEEGFYYANKGNRFFKVLSVILNDEAGETTQSRKAFLKRHKIALFDVISECDIKGSSDSSIKNVVVNDIEGIVQQTQIKAVFTTGNTATKLYKKYVECNTPHYKLPSTSGANAAMHLEDLVEAYNIIKEFLDEQ